MIQGIAPPLWCCRVPVPVWSSRWVTEDMTSCGRNHPWISTWIFICMNWSSWKSSRTAEFQGYPCKMYNATAIMRMSRERKGRGARLGLSTLPAHLAWGRRNSQAQCHITSALFQFPCRHLTRINSPCKADGSDLNNQEILELGKLSATASHWSPQFIDTTRL